MGLTPFDTMDLGQNQEFIRRKNQGLCTLVQIADDLDDLMNEKKDTEENLKIKPTIENSLFASENSIKQ